MMESAGRGARSIVMRLVLAAIAVAVAAPAHAAPVAEDYELYSDNGWLVVAKGKRRAPVASGSWEVDKLDVDRKQRRVTVPMLTECTDSAKVTYAFDQLEARLVNADALALHRKHQWAKAEPGFAAAAKLDPTWRLPAYNLASARTELHDLPGAVAALGPWLASEPIATYVQASLDPELRPLLATKELAAVRAPERGAMRVDNAVLEGGYGYGGGLIAAQAELSDGMSCITQISVWLFDAKTGKKLADVPLSKIEGCTAHQALLEKDRGEVVARLLGDLGVRRTDVEEHGASDAPSGSRVVHFVKPKLGIASSGNGLNVMHDGRSILEAKLGAGLLVKAAWLAAANAIVAVSVRPSDVCPDSSVDAILLP